MLSRDGREAGKWAWRAPGRTWRNWTRYPKLPDLGAGVLMPDSGLPCRFVVSHALPPPPCPAPPPRRQRRAQRPLSAPPAPTRLPAAASPQLNPQVNPQVNPFSLVMGGAVLQMGLSPEGAIGAATVAAVVTTLALISNSAAGAKYGVPFPVYARASFGVHGAKIVALIRGIVAIFWLAIQNWFGSQMLYFGISSAAPGISDTPRIDGGYMNLAEFLLFLGFTGMGCLLVLIGLERMKGFVMVATGFGAVALVALSVMSFVQASPAAVHRALQGREGLSTSSPIPFGQAVNSCVSSWSTLILNMADLARYAKSQRDQAVGQAVGFPTVYVALFAFSIFLCGAFFVAEGRLVWDLSPMLATWSPYFSIPVALCLSVGVLAVNLSANIVSPANDFANLWPERISFRAGAYATLLLSLCAVPWRIMSSAKSLMEIFLSGYSMLTGGIFTVMTWNFFIVNGRKLDVPGLYVKGPRGPYYGAACGFSPIAFLSILGGAAVCVPGWLHDLGAVDVPIGVAALFDLSWFISGVTAAILYAALHFAVSRARRKA